MYSPLAQRFSADHRACVEVYYQSEVFDYAYTDMSNAGLDFYVKQPQLRSRLGQEELDFYSDDEMHAFMEEAEAAGLGVWAFLPAAGGYGTIKYNGGVQAERDGTYSPRAAGEGLE